MQGRRSFVTGRGDIIASAESTSLVGGSGSNPPENFKF